MSILWSIDEGGKQDCSFVAGVEEEGRGPLETSCNPRQPKDLNNSRKKLLTGPLPLCDQLLSILIQFPNPLSTLINLLCRRPQPLSTLYKPLHPSTILLQLRMMRL